MNTTNKELLYREFIQREDEILRAAYNPELEFYAAIKLGDLKRVEELCQERLIDKKGLGTLSDNYLQNIKYHFVITTAIVARYCIEGGMEVAKAYTISDYYIQKADRAKTIEEVSALHPKMCLDYAKRMRNLQKRKVSSMPVVKCIEFIYDNLHKRITVEMLSEYTGFAPTYLSRLFKKETGSSISDYIQAFKIETACNMLVYSDYSIADIALTLAFPSQSYFNYIFKKRMGVTPKNYKLTHFRETSIANSERQ